MDSRKIRTERGLRPGAECNHDYPIAVMTTENGRCAYCLRCKMVGPVRKDSQAARRALLARPS